MKTVTLTVTEAQLKLMTDCVHAVVPVGGGSDINCLSHFLREQVETQLGIEDYYCSDAHNASVMSILSTVIQDWKDSEG